MASKRLTSFRDFAPQPCGTGIASGKRPKREPKEVTMRGVRGASIVALVAVLGSAGCFFEPASTGEEGVIEYAYADGILGCLFGCDAREPMAEGSHALVMILDADELPPFTVASDDPTVALFTRDGAGSSGVHAEALAPGEARIVVRDATSGEVIDRLPMRVRAVDRIEVDSGDLPGPRTFLEGTRFVIRPTSYDGRGSELVGVGALSYEVTAGLEADDEEAPFGLDIIAEAFASLLAGHNQEYAELEATAVGEGRVRITAVSGVTTSVPVRVVSVDEVTRVEVGTDGERDEDGRLRVEAEVWAGDRAIWGPTCSWSIEPVTGPVTLESTSGGTALLASDGHGSATVTCTVGGASDSLVVTF
jgi:hypothetical protein